MRIGAIIGAVLAFIMLVGVIGSMTTVPAGHQAVLVTWGKVNYEKTLSPGFHVIPFWIDVEPRNIQVKKEEVHAKAFSIDLQEADIVVALNYRPMRQKINRLFEEYGDEFVERVIVPAVHESVKAGTAKFSAEDIIGQREVVKEAVISDLRERLARGYIELVELNIVDFDFKTAFKEAVESKQIMAQEALEEKNKKDKEKWIADQKIEQARGEAARIRQKAEAISTNPQVLVLEAIQAWSDGGAQVPTTIVVGGDAIDKLFGVVNGFQITSNKKN